ncbi:glycosyltransferase family 8 protein [Phytomonospora endophytica]|uniref:Lipopolysaccharide biosynthesis glycosyltransferase n=1 Tax=Phytomonospora endophytica TaxID=714109 RepID=A0A841G0J2_9ACTN|nr:glycosyltransferase [Phytomonospora endophytica]MBB6038199.1 lipopolysaccharide biosynthesis glycosyltransferase [Phytomonospora endophytica]GIG67341.1 hypothetical protein Pen01_36360 [Phytomonospora endophytica]
MLAFGLCVDRRYFDPGLVTLASIADATPHQARRATAVRVLSSDLSRSEATVMARFARRLGFGSFDLRWARPTRSAVMADTAYISVATYLRFAFTAEFVARPYLIYIDADVLVRGDITSELASLGKSRLGGVVDEFNAAIGSCPALPGLVSDRPELVGRPYLNAGVLWLHASGLGTVQRGVEAALRDGARYILHNDQDALNLWLLESGSGQAMSAQFNRFEIARFLEFGDWTRRVVPRGPSNSDAALIHFVGAHKPWLSSCPATEDVREYRAVRRRALRLAGRDDALVSGATARHEGR